MYISDDKMLAADLQPPSRLLPPQPLPHQRPPVSATADTGPDRKSSTAGADGGSLRAGLLVAGAAVALTAYGATTTTRAAKTTTGTTMASGTTTLSITAPQASRFLSQAAWGGHDAGIAEVRALGYAGWIEKQFAAARAQSHFDWMKASGYLSQALMFSTLGLDASIWRKLMSAPDLLRQRMVLALSEIFVVSPAGMPVPFSGFVCAGYLDLLEARCFGNFRDLLEAVTLSPAMGIYLSMMGNKAEDPATGRMPDENYAREIMQLFTLGLYQLDADGSVKRDALGQPIESYDQADVMGLAKVFTGWDMVAVNGDIEVARTPMAFNAAAHSPAEKRFLGVTVPAGTGGQAALRTALDTLFQHPNVGPFIARQLIQRLVTSNPSPAYVARVAAAFNNNGAGVRGDLKAVLRAILLDSEARATPVSPAWGRLREPVVRLVQWARTFSATSPSDHWGLGDTSDPATRLAQSPLRAKSVFNFFRPDYVPPNAILPQQGLVVPEMQITHEASVTAYLNLMQYVISEGADDVKADYSRELPLAGNPAQLVDRCNLLLAGGQLSATTVGVMRSAITAMPAVTSADKRNRVCAAVFMTMASPEYLVMK